MRNELLKLSSKLNQQGMKKQSESVLRIMKMAQIPHKIEKPELSGGSIEEEGMSGNKPSNKRKSDQMSSLYYDALSGKNELPQERLEALRFIREYEDFSSESTLDEKKYEDLYNKYQGLSQSARDEVKVLINTRRGLSVDGLRDMIKSIELGSQSFSSVERPSLDDTKQKSATQGAVLARKLKGLYNRISESNPDDENVFRVNNARLSDYIKQYKSLNAIAKREVCRRLDKAIIDYFKDDREEFLIHC